MLLGKERYKKLNGFGSATVSEVGVRQLEAKRARRRTADLQGSATAPNEAVNSLAVREVVDKSLHRKFVVDYPVELEVALDKRILPFDLSIGWLAVIATGKIGHEHRCQAAATRQCKLVLGKHRALVGRRVGQLFARQVTAKERCRLPCGSRARDDTAVVAWCKNPALASRGNYDAIGIGLRGSGAWISDQNRGAKRQRHIGELAILGIQQ